MILKTIKGYPAPEFGGLVTRVLARDEVKDIDPFLMLDFFDVETEQFPDGNWHPHRGIETFTYITRGNMKEKDTLNGELAVTAGGALHLSAGSGIYHTGLSTHTPDGIQGFQLWFNIPKKNKMDAPFTQAFQNEEFPHIELEQADIKVLSGTFNNVKGPLDKSNLGLRLLDVAVDGEVTLNRTIGKKGYLFVYEGEGFLNDTKLEAKTAYILDEGNFTVTGNIKFLLNEGTPLNEFIVWRGPIVMNTKEEIIKAYQELNDGTFIKEI